MDTTETLKRFEEVTNHYLLELDGLSTEQLSNKPSENEWSLGQMYLHLINTALYMQLRNAEQCMALSSDSGVATGEKTEAGKAVFDLGGFPPVRIQVQPSPMYTPQQPESKDQLVQGLTAVLSRMKEMEPTIDQAPMHNTVAHPRLGALNAKEWFELVEMHYRHHLLQEKRLRRGFENRESNSTSS